jgi:hypothetical protein
MIRKLFALAALATVAGGLLAIPAEAGTWTGPDWTMAPSGKNSPTIVTIHTGPDCHMVAERIHGHIHHVKVCK